MILDNNSYLLDGGFRIDRSTPTEVLDRCREYAERVHLVACIGADAVTEAQAAAGIEPQPESIAGGAIFIGLRRALAYIAVAHLLMSDTMATPFGTVRKKDDRSENVDGWHVAVMYESIGNEAIAQYAELAGCEYRTHSGRLIETV